MNKLSRLVSSTYLRLATVRVDSTRLDFCNNRKAVFRQLHVTFISKAEQESRNDHAMGCYINAKTEQLVVPSPRKRKLIADQSFEFGNYYHRI